MWELEIEAKTQYLEQVRAFVDGHLEMFDCPVKAKMQIDMAVEEIFVNISQYAYTPKTGKVTIRMEMTKEPLSVVLTFLDNGIPYNPLAKADPDVTLPAQEREIGGLGIYMVKNIMDDVAYAYQDGRNILKLRKKIELQE